MTNARLKRAILDFGLEDLIGLPELLFEHDVLAEAAPENAIDDISRALVELCEEYNTARPHRALAMRTPYECAKEYTA